MKKRNILIGIFMSFCCSLAAAASVDRSEPVSPEIMRGVLYMTSNISRPDQAGPDPKAAPAPSVSENDGAAPVEVPAPAEEGPPVTPAVERTAAPLPKSSEELKISNLANAEVNIDELLSMPPETAGAQVLILHTHACESYTPTAENYYAVTKDFRTTDKDFNVVRVGDEIQKELEALGVTVIHDTTLCDEPDFNKSYSNSLAVAKKYLAENPGIKVILDVHRDSIEDGQGRQVKTNGPDGASQLMFVVGTDMGGAEHPLWRQNLSFALNLQRRLTDGYPGLMRPINLRSSRFNQQLSTGSIIVEVGSDGNTLEEALAAARIFGRELGGYLTGK